MLLPSFLTTAPSSLTFKAASFFLLAGLLVYPFSIAGSNFFFALLLLTIFLFQRDVLKQGWKICWHNYKHITIGVLLYSLLTITGILWSDNIEEALRLFSKQVYWILVPAIIGISMQTSNKFRKQAYLCVSIGLFLHLIVCSLQYFQVITIPQSGLGGTSASDPTGFLGHLSFGFIYGIWIGTLLIQASTTQGKWKYLYYIISLYAFMSIFLTQGRSGYLISIALLLLVFWKIYLKNISAKQIVIIFILIIAATSLFFTVNLAGKNKLIQTTVEIQAYINNDLSASNIRLKIWDITFDIWQENLVLGIGTGDFREEFNKKVQSPQYASYKMAQQSYNHPHNDMLFSLVRWGPVGLLVFLYLIYAWVSTGLKFNWEKQPMSAYLITASGLAVLINSFSSSSLTALVTLVFAIITLTFGLSKNSSSVRK